MTEVEICNQALGLVAEQRITALTDSTQLARLCNLHFAETVREVLRDGQWRCARHRVALAPLAQAPAFEWACAYQLPGDFLRTIRLNGHAVGSADMPLFEIEGRQLLMNETEARIVYTRDITQGGAGAGIAELDPLCARSIIVLLASKLAWHLQQSRTLRESLLQEYEQVLSSARNANSRDAFEHTIEPSRRSNWVGSR